MLLVDTQQGKIWQDEEIKERYIHRQPYGSGWTAIWWSLKA